MSERRNPISGELYADEDLGVEVANARQLLDLDDVYRVALEDADSLWADLDAAGKDLVLRLVTRMCIQLSRQLSGRYDTIGFDVEIVVPDPYATLSRWRRFRRALAFWRRS